MIRYVFDERLAPKHMTIRGTSVALLNRRPHDSALRQFQCMKRPGLIPDALRCSNDMSKQTTKRMSLCCCKLILNYTISDLIWQELLVPLSPWGSLALVA